MEITIEQAQGRVPVTVMKLDGELEAKNYVNVIDSGKEIYEAGARDLLMDLSDLSFMSSSGLVALHSLVLLMRGEEPDDPEAGWSALHAIAEEVESGAKPEEHFKLLNPQPRVDKTLEITGFKKLFEIHTDREEAIASF
jgi:anti-anti-sigma regulatory factor